MQNFITPNEKKTQTASQDLYKECLKVCWSVWFWDISNKSFWTCGLWVGYLWVGHASTRCLQIVIWVFRRSVEYFRLLFPEQILWAPLLLQQGGTLVKRGRFRWVPSTKSILHVNARMQVFTSECCIAHVYLPEILMLWPTPVY